ncbi:MAG: RteC domain-containing protein [Bacteroidota bacterium]
MNTTEIRSSAVVLHREMLDKLTLLCGQHYMDMVKRMALSVYLIEEYLNKLYVLLPEHGFEDMSQEVLFFKCIKPLFVSEREFYQRRHNAETYSDNSVSYWVYELERMNKLYQENIEFVAYYRSGETLNDFAWFTRGQAPLPTSLCVLPWETNPWHTSARDAWVSGLLAVDRYCEWLNTNIRKLKE